MAATSFPVETSVRRPTRDWFDQIWSSLALHYPTSELQRLKELFDVLSGCKSPEFKTRGQLPYSFYLPGLRATPIWDRDSLPQSFLGALSLLENSAATISAEYQDLQDSGGLDFFQHYSGDGDKKSEGGVASDSEVYSQLDANKPDLGSNSKNKMVSAGQWRVFYFYRNFERIDDNCKRCPKTAQILDQLGKYALKGMVCFSRLEPGTHILPHTGPSNMRLTCHLGISGCQDCWVRVHTYTQPYQEERCLLFDDTFVHEVHHLGQMPRVTLMLDFWHPGLTSIEKEAFSFMMRRSLEDGLDQELFYHSLDIYNINDYLR